MEKLIRKITNAVIIAIAGTAGLLGMYVVFKGADTVNLVAYAPIAMDATFYLMYFLAIIGAALILGFGILQIISSKAQIIKTLVIAVVAVVVYWLCYLIAPAELSETAMKIGITEGAYKLVGAMLNFVYVMFLGVVFTFFGMYVYTKIKNR